MTRFFYIIVILINISCDSLSSDESGQENEKPGYLYQIGDIQKVTYSLNEMGAQRSFEFDLKSSKILASIDYRIGEEHIAKDEVFLGKEDSDTILKIFNEVKIIHKNEHSQDSQDECQVEEDTLTFFTVEVETALETLILKTYLGLCGYPDFDLEEEIRIDWDSFMEVSIFLGNKVDLPSYEEATAVYEPVPM